MTVPMVAMAGAALVLGIFPMGLQDWVINLLQQIF